MPSYLQIEYSLSFCIILSFVLPDDGIFDVKCCLKTVPVLWLLPSCRDSRASWSAVPLQKPVNSEADSTCWSHFLAQYHTTVAWISHKSFYVHFSHINPVEHTINPVENDYNWSGTDPVFATCRSRASCHCRRVKCHVSMWVVQCRMWGPQRGVWVSFCLFKFIYK